MESGKCLWALGESTNHCTLLLQQNNPGNSLNRILKEERSGSKIQELYRNGEVLVGVCNKKR